MASIRFRRRTRRPPGWLPLLVAVLLAVGVCGGAVLFGWLPGSPTEMGSGPAAEADAGDVGSVAATASPTGESSTTLGMGDAEPTAGAVERGALSELLPELSGDLSQDVLDVPATRRVEVATGSVSEVATDLVGSFRAVGDAVLVHAGYLDLVGDVWGCVVSRPGTVEVLLVSSAEGGGSRVTTLEMEAEEWERAYAKEQE